MRKDNHLAPDDRTPQEKKELKAFIKALRFVLNQFNTEDQEILTMRFGLNDGEGRTLEEVGDKFDVTREYIRELEAQAWKLIRK